MLGAMPTLPTLQELKTQAARERDLETKARRLCETGQLQGPELIALIRAVIVAEFSRVMRDDDRRDALRNGEEG